jgi:hypothetical protein
VPVYDRLPEVTECEHERIGARRFGNDPSSSKMTDGLRDLMADPADDAVGSHQAAAATVGIRRCATNVSTVGTLVMAISAPEVTISSNSSP